MRDKNGTVQHSVVEQIGELTLRIPATGNTQWSKEPDFAELVATDFAVKVEFSYTPGDEPRSFGPPDTWDDGTPPEVIIKAIKADSNVHFDNGDGIALTAARGTDLLPLFSHSQLLALEDKLLARAEAGSDE